MSIPNFEQIADQIVADIMTECADHLRPLIIHFTLNGSPTPEQQLDFASIGVTPNNIRDAMRRYIDKQKVQT